VPDGPAAKAGVEAGDVVTAVDGKPAGGLTLDDVRAALRDPGATRVLTLKRGTKEVTAKVTLRRPV
jgi:S1-C subfamily serine protease